VLTAFAAGALLLAAIGLYGVLAFAVAQRTREIGVRIALGASPGSVLALVVREGMALVAIGLIFGLAGAIGTTRLMTTLLYRTEPLDPWTFAAVPVVLASVALLACYLPARRAARVEPMVALRTE
jgi:putative ABC transport system permease protein